MSASGGEPAGREGPDDPVVALRPTTAADAPFLLRLWNDGRVMRWVGFPEGLGADTADVAAWFRATAAEPNRHHFVVVADGVEVGEVFAHRGGAQAALDIKLVPEAWGRGVGTRALRGLLEWLFAAHPEVHEAWVDPVDSNAAALSLYRRCGFVPSDRPADPGHRVWVVRR